MRTVLVIAMLIVGCGVEPTPMKQMDGVWSLDVVVQPVSILNPAPPPPAMHLTTRATMESDSLRGVLSGLCPGPIIVEHKADYPYWTGGAEACVLAWPESECNGATFSLTYLSLELDPTSGDLKGEGSGSVHDCGADQDALVYVIGKRSDHV